MTKEHQKSTEDENLMLFIFQQLKSGLRPSKILEELDMKQTAFQYYISSLKQGGFIKKVGYGTWEILKDYDKKNIKKSTAVANIKGNKFDVLLPDSVRGHAFQFVLQLPQNLKNWDKREEIFAKIGYKFKKLQIPVNSQAIEFKGRKVHLTDKSIIIYEKESFIEETAKESQSQAIDHFLKLIKQLEKDLQASFSFGNRYRFRVSRQHYSLIKNALAKQYNDVGERLEVYNDKGLWFLIDNSFNLNEAETVHAKTAVSDNKKVQDFFNGVKQLEGFTPQFVTDSIGSLAQNWNEYGLNIKSHIKAIQDLGAGVEQYNKGISEILKAIKELKK